MKKAMPTIVKAMLALTMLTNIAWADDCVAPQVQVSGYDYVSCLQEGLAIVGKNGKVGFIDEAGQMIIPLRFGWGWGFSEGLAVVGNGDEVGYINKAGKIVIPLHFEDAGSFVNGLAWVEKDGVGFYINKQGQRVE